MAVDDGRYRLHPPPADQTLQYNSKTRTRYESSFSATPFVHAARHHRTGTTHKVGRARSRAIFAPIWSSPINRCTERRQVAILRRRRSLAKISPSPPPLALFMSHAGARKFEHSPGRQVRGAGGGRKRQTGGPSPRLWLIQATKRRQR